MGRCICDEELLKGQVAAFWVSFGSWRSEDGHCHSTEATYLLLMRALTAQLEEATEVADAALRAWLPKPAELLQIAEYECVWRAANAGSHPSIICAALHGERLGDWDAAGEVAAGVLLIEAYNPLLRIQAYRLLARAMAEREERAAACEASERAAAEAARARYVWFEISLRWWHSPTCSDGARRARRRKRLGRGCAAWRAVWHRPRRSSLRCLGRVCSEP